jgi:hypothetical protein
MEQDICVLYCERLINRLRCLVLLPIDELPTNTLLLGQLRDLCDLCQRQDGKSFAFVGGHVGGNALWVIHLALASREKEQVSTMGWWPQPTALLVGGLDFTGKVLHGFEPRQNYQQSIMGELK